MSIPGFSPWPDIPQRSAPEADFDAKIYAVFQHFAVTHRAEMLAFITWLENNSTVIGAALNGTSIGQTVPALGRFTTLEAESLGGTAVQSDPLDQVAGRALLTGAYGANKSVAVPSGNIDLAVVGGIYHGYGGAHASASTGDNPFPALNGAFVLRVENLGIGGAGEYLTQTVTAVSGPDPGHKRTRIINTSGNGFSDWFDDYSAAKEPDVYGSNPSGQYLKMSDGTLIMWRDRIPITITNAVSAAWTGSFPTTYTGGIALVPSAGGGNSAENDFGSYLPTGRVANGAPELGLRHVSGTARSDTLYGGYTAFTRWE